MYYATLRSIFSLMLSTPYLTEKKSQFSDLVKLKTITFWTYLVLLATAQYHAHAGAYTKHTELFKIAFHG